MSDRRLVVAELDPIDPHNGELFALTPGAATGIAIPTFRIGNTLPIVGTEIGQSFYEESTKKGFVWNGSAWREIAASPVKRFADRPTLLANTTEPVGTFAVTADSGEVYIRQKTGWAFIGIREYATAALLLADAAQTGTVATALDEGSLWQKQTSGWRCLTIRELPDLAAVQAWTGTAAQGAHVGDTALALDNELTYSRTSNGWRPESLWEDTEANIRAATWPMNGQEAIASDTGRTFVRIGGAWIEEPIQHYADEATLLAAAVPDGTLAWADDTNVVFTRAAGAWKRLQGPQISYGTTAPTTPGVGDMWFDSSANRQTLFLWTGTNWIGSNGLTIGGAGSKVVIPGYFNEVPSNTATADDVGGLAFWYYAAQTQLYLNKGNAWHSMTPVLGDAGNAGKVAMADTNGNMTWGTGAPLQIKHVSNPDSSHANQLVQAVQPKVCLRQYGTFSPKVNISYPRILCEHNGNWIDFSDGSMVFDGSCIVRWASGGAEIHNLHQGSDSGGGLLINNSQDYAVGQHSPCPFEFRVLGFGLQGTNDFCNIYFKLGPYKNRNGREQTVEGLYRMGAPFDPIKIQKMGIKFNDNSNTGPVSLTTEFL